MGYGRTTRGGHGLPKVSPGPARQATRETILLPFQGWPTHKVGGLRPCSTPLDTLRRTPMEVGTAKQAFVLEGEISLAEQRILETFALPPCASGEFKVLQ
jgi:hypothetical protein